MSDGDEDDHDKKSFGTAGNLLTLHLLTYDILKGQAHLTLKVLCFQTTEKY